MVNYHSFTFVLILSFPPFLINIFTFFLPSPFSLHFYHSFTILLSSPQSIFPFLFLLYSHPIFHFIFIFILSIFHPLSYYSSKNLVSRKNKSMLSNIEWLKKWKTFCNTFCNPKNFYQIIFRYASNT